MSKDTKKTSKEASTQIQQANNLNLDPEKLAEEMAKFLEDQPESVRPGKCGGCDLILSSDRFGTIRGTRGK